MGGINSAMERLRIVCQRTVHHFENVKITEKRNIKEEKVMDHSDLLSSTLVLCGKYYKTQ